MSEAINSLTQTETLRPETEAELAAIIRAAKGPLSVRGGGTRGMAGPGAPLWMDRMRGIMLYEPGALTLVVRAGTPLAEVEAALAAEGQHLAFEPADYRGLLETDGTPTIGGVIAANISGPRRVQAGAARDFLLGVRFVDGSGTILKNGGRVMKNVTGYDLSRLLAGARGTLGVLTEVALKVLPAPAAAATLRIRITRDHGAGGGASGADAAGAGRHGLPVAEAAQTSAHAEAHTAAQTAVAAMSAALSSPFDVTGAAFVGGCVLVRVEGFAASVAYRYGRLVSLLARFGTILPVEDPAMAADRWSAVRDARPFHGRPGDVWRLSVKPGDAPEVIGRIMGRVGGQSREMGSDEPERADCMLDWGGGLIWVRVPAGTDLRAVAAPYTGHATLVRGTGACDVGAFTAEARDTGAQGAVAHGGFAHGGNAHGGNAQGGNAHGGNAHGGNAHGGTIPGPGLMRDRMAQQEPEPPGVEALTEAMRRRFDPRGVLNAARWADTGCNAPGDDPASGAPQSASRVASAGPAAVPAPGAR